MTEQTKLKQLVSNGLYQDNLTELIEICDISITKGPTLFFILKNIFWKLESEYDDQAIESRRYEKVNELIPFILAAIDNPSVNTFDELISKFDDLG